MVQQRSRNASTHRQARAGGGVAGKQYSIPCPLSCPISASNTSLRKLYVAGVHVRILPIANRWHNELRESIYCRRTKCVYLVLRIRRSLLKYGSPSRVARSKDPASFFELSTSSSIPTASAIARSPSNCWRDGEGCRRRTERVGKCLWILIGTSRTTRNGISGTSAALWVALQYDRETKKEKGRRAQLRSGS